jgi:hypothetical protein
MELFWKAALAVAGIGGLGLFVLWSLYKQWLRLSIFPRLTQNQAFRLLLCFLIFTFAATTFAIIAFLITHNNDRSAGDVPLHTEDLRLPSGSKFTDVQFDTYRSVWITLQELRQTGDALWSVASPENLDAFVRALIAAKKQAASGAIFFHEEDYRELMALLDHFASFGTGKERLIEMRNAHIRNGGTWEPWEVGRIEVQIQRNRQLLERYTALLNKCARRTTIA